MITAVENVSRKGNHEHAHEQSYVGPDQQCLAPLAGLPSALSLGICSFFSLQFFRSCLGFGVDSSSGDGHVSASESGHLYLTLFPDRPAGPCLTMRSPATATAVSSKAVVQ